MPKFKFGCQAVFDMFHLMVLIIIITIAAADGVRSRHSPYCDAGTQRSLMVSQTLPLEGGGGECEKGSCARREGCCRPRVRLVEAPSWSRLSAEPSTMLDLPD